MQAADSQSDSGVEAPTAFTTLPTPIGPRDHSAQREWEHYQVRRGIERYQRSLVQEREDGGFRDKRLDEVQVGNRVASDMVGPLIDLLRQKQAEALVALADKNLKRVSEADAALCALSAETLAACVVLTALASAPDATYLGVSRDTGSRIQHELEFAMWKEAEAAAARERKAADSPFVPDLFKLMVKRNDTVDMRVFKKWSQKASLFTKGDWPARTKALVGGYFVTLLVESNAWYEIKDEWQTGHNKSKLMFRMTEMGLAVISQLHNEAEYQRPFMLPMICEPADYEYIEVDSMKVGEGDDPNAIDCASTEAFC